MKSTLATSLGLLTVLTQGYQLFFGFIGFLLDWGIFYPLIQILISISAVVLGIQGLRERKSTAIIGIICGSIGTLFGIITLLLFSIRM